MNTNQINSGHVQYFSVDPKAIDKDMILKIKNLILSGSEVTDQVLLRNLTNAKNITYAVKDDMPIAVIVIKTPIVSYVRDVFDKANSIKNYIMYRSELGYMYAMPEYRRSRVILNLFNLFKDKFNSKTFATVRKENTNAIRLLERIGYIQSGQSYTSERGNYEILLYVSD